MIGLDLQDLNLVWFDLRLGYVKTKVKDGLVRFKVRLGFDHDQGW